ncbi:hypothetical protein [Arthrobacter sp. CAN_C5]|uniref:hypothetical protein n=1 Tax=Arthrobacter sp. CAN_C5 TaxID=2760706 RepID=UPI001AE342F6|nr:hypothetical protein [Arthrobacter sp. CAN_C5]MBP2216003.1 hypothetical protein [Arthrobacter sp. CAN_C5]
MDEDQLEAPNRERSRREGVWIAIGFALVAAVAGGLVGAGMNGAFSSPAETSPPTETSSPTETVPSTAAELLALEQPPAEVKIGTTTIPVRGRVAGELPAGVQLWAGVRMVSGWNDVPALARDSLFSLNPCVVDEAAGTFDCLDVRFGLNELPGEGFAVYVFLTDTETALALLEIEDEQVRGNTVNSGPLEFDALEPIFIEQI